VPERVSKVKLSFKEVLDLSFKNIRRRFARAAITIVTIILATSFLTFLTTTSIVLRQYAEADISVEAYQYWLAFISLLLCVVSITNSMTIAVYERYKEIGIIKCLGALNRHVLLFFFMESTIMGLVGGGLGFLCGSATAVAVYGFQLGLDMILRIPPFELLFCFGLSVIAAFGISTSATMYPAYKAAKSKPAEAFRVEA
jgi:ABC-type lipoprotein release transport system permease subunit